ncbi:MAG: VOC family protein, partial [Acidimicrobiales bacterium]
MADPFEALRAPVTPVVPDPAFSAQLRARIERAMQLPRGVTVSNLIIETAPEAGAPVATRQEPAKRLSATLVPYLAVSGASRALEWYSEALGAQVRGEPYVMPDGTIGHAELEIAGGLLMLSEQSPGIGVVAPVPGEGVPVTIHLSVDDVDGVIGRAVRAGALLDRAPADYEYGRNGVFRDPFGHRWLVSAEPVRHEGPAGLREGDVAYVSLWVPDVERAASFFSNVLDWSYAAGSGPEGRQVEGLNIRHGMWGRQPRSNLFLCFAVSDVHSAAERVRSAGGTAEEPHREPYGMISE